MLWVVIALMLWGCLLWSALSFPWLGGVLSLSIVVCRLMPPFLLWSWVAEVPWFGCCCWIVLATLGPRTTLCCLVDLSGAHLLFGISPGCLCLLHRTVKGLLCCGYSVIGPWTVLAWPICWWPNKPNGVGLADCVPRLCVTLLDPYPWRNHAQLGGGSVLRDWWARWPMVGWNVAAT